MRKEGCSLTEDETCLRLNMVERVHPLIIGNLRDLYASENPGAQKLKELLGSLTANTKLPESCENCPFFEKRYQ